MFYVEYFYSFFKGGSFFYDLDVLVLDYIEDFFFSVNEEEVFEEVFFDVIDDEVFIGFFDNIYID